MKASYVLVLVAAAADADPRDSQGGAQLSYELSEVHDVEDDAMAPPGAKDLILASGRLHGFVGGRSIVYHIGLDLAAGGTVGGGGFAYDCALFPVGVGVRFFESSFVTLGVGIGANGATGALDDAVTFPLEARLELGRGIRVLGRARATYLAAAKARQDGAVSTTLADELEAMLAVRLGRSYDDFGFPSGNGYFVGVAYRELMGARFVGAIIGYSLDAGTSRRARRAECPDCD